MKSSTRYRRADGYIELHLDSKIRVLEHRYVLAQTLNRKLTPDDIVHHINGIRDDNRLENLEVTNRSEHAKHHGAERPAETLDATCAKCEKPFALLARKHRYRAKTQDNPVFFCSRACGRPSGRRLSDEQIGQVRKLLTAGFSLAHIAKQMNVSKATIGHIKTGKTYAH